MSDRIWCFVFLFCFFLFLVLFFISFHWHQLLTSCLSSSSSLFRFRLKKPEPAERCVFFWEVNEWENRARRRLSEGNGCDCLQEVDGRWIPRLRSLPALQTPLPGDATKGACRAFENKKKEEEKMEGTRCHNHGRLLHFTLHMSSVVPDNAAKSDWHHWLLVCHRYRHRRIKMLNS